MVTLLALLAFFKEQGLNVETAPCLVREQNEISLRFREL